MKSNFLISTTNCKEIIHVINRVIEKHRNSLYKHILIENSQLDLAHEQPTWYVTWESWIEDGILSCMTVRSLCHVIYGNYDRAQHSINFVLQSMRTEIPLLDVYLSFDGTNFIGDNVMTFKPITLQNLGLVNFHEICTSTSVQETVEQLNSVVIEEAKNMQEEEEWHKQWKHWKDNGLMECETLDDLIYIARLETEPEIALVLKSLFDRIPPLVINCEYTELDKNVVVLKNLWTTVAQGNKPTVQLPTPMERSGTTVNNSFNLLTQQVATHLDDDSKSTPSALSSTSKQLSQQFSEQAHSKSPDQSDQQREDKDGDNLTDEDYDEICKLVQSNQSENLDLRTYEQYVESTMRRAQVKFYEEIKEFTVSTTKDISAHKQRLKLELDKKQNKVEKRVNEFESKMDKLRNDMNKEEAAHITAIAEKGHSTISQLNSSVETLTKLMQDLQSTTQSTVQINANAKRIKNDVQDVMTKGYNTFYQDMQDTMQDCKNELMEWKSKQVLPNESMKTLIENQQDRITDQANTIASMTADINILQREIAAVKRVQSNPVHATSPRSNTSSRQDPPETPPPVQHRPIPTYAPSSTNAYAPTQQTSFQPINAPPEPPVNSTSVPPVAQPKFSIGNYVNYKRGIRNFRGTITDFQEYTGSQNCQYTYTISMHHRNPTGAPNVFRNCLETFISLVAAPSPLNVPTPMNDDCTMATIDRESHDHTDWNDHNLAENEYQQPIGSKTKRMNIPSMLKNAKDWPSTMIVTNKYDIKKLYTRLKNKFGLYNILLQPWDAITKNCDIIALNPVNCLNFDSARKTMSHAIYDYFDQFKEEIFETYTAPQFAIAAFESETDGAGYLKYILSEVHPHLRDLTDYDKMSKPHFSKCKDIHHFISKYLEWIKEEKMLNNRKYTDKENIDYVLSELDERFTTARSKIETRINDLYADPLNPKPFPEVFKATPKLSINIMNLIPRQEQNGTDYTNNIPIINKVNRRQERNDRRGHKKTNKKNFDNIEWKYMPGAVCSACGQNNHEIYSTGCPAMAIFCNCKKFYDSVDPETLEPVLEQFTKFKAEQRKRQSSKKKQLRASIKALKSCSDQPTIRKVFFDQYLDEFPEAEHEPNPFEQRYDSEEDSSE